VGEGGGDGKNRGLLAVGEEQRRSRNLARSSARRWADGGVMVV
jgi:hypothetical protein